MPGAASRRTVLAGAVLALTGCAAPRRLPPPLPRLDAVLDLAMADRSTAALIARGDQVLTERYATGWPSDRPRELASVAKSLLAVLIGMAIEDGLLTGLEQPAADFVPAWRHDGRRTITLRHLMSMTSGLDDTGLALRGVTGDQFVINSAAPLRDPPGDRWAYNTAAYHLLFHILARATGERVEVYAARRLLEPLGMAQTSWIVGTGQGPAGPVVNYYSAASTARDLARFGSFILNHGRWNGRQLIDAEFIRVMTSPSQTLNPSYGLLWWTNAQPGFDAFGRGPGHRFPRSPRDTVAALGAGGQALLLVPSRDLIIVRQGAAPETANLPDLMVSGAIEALRG